MKPEKNRLDCLACGLFADVHFVEFSEEIRSRFGIDLAASSGFTGNHDNWVLESHGTLDVKDLYFTERINDFQGRLVRGACVVA